MRNHLAIRLAAITGFLAVALGAFGAHALREILSEHGRVATWETAVLYHFVHALMMFLLANQPRLKSGPYLCFLVGILIFSGSLYVLCVTGIRWLGAITPLGGLAFLAGWLWLAIAGVGRRDEATESKREA